MLSPSLEAVAGAEAAAEGAAEPEPAGEPEAVAEPEPAGDPEAVAEPEPEAVAGAEAAAEPEPAGEPEPAAAAEPQPVAAAPAAEAEAAAEPAAIPADAASTPDSSKEIVVVKMNLNLEDLPDDLSAEEFESAIERTVMQFKEGSLVEGTVVRVDPDEVLIDIGFKSEGHIPAKELSIRNQVNPDDEVSVGDTIEAMVLEMEDSEGRMILSKKRAQYERAWGRIEKVMAAGETVKGAVIEVVKGGLIVDIGLRGFLPASLVELRRVRDLQPYVGEEIEAKVIELDKNRNNVVLSRRAYLEEEQAEQRTAFLGDLAEDQIRNGVVSSVVNFGAFVDLGGMDGLVHVSELSWQHVSHPSEVVSVGDEVTVKVLEVDRRPGADFALDPPDSRGSLGVVLVGQRGGRCRGRQSHQDRAVRRVRVGHRRGRRPGPRVGDRHAPRRESRARADGRSSGQRAHHRDRRRSPPHQPLHQTGAAGVVGAERSAEAAAQDASGARVRA